MLHIEVPKRELWDERLEEFVQFPGQKLQLEHSLVSVQKWEAKWNRPFLTQEPKTIEQTLDYIRCMTLTQNPRPDTYLYLTPENITAIDDYIDAPMTATTFSEIQEGGKGKGRHEIITAELIYYWMIANNIPFECKKWHLNSLLTLIRVCSIKNAPQKKMSKREIAKQNAALNAARLKRYNTKG